MVEAIFNGCEAALWLSLAVFVTARYHRAPVGLWRVARVMGVLFVLFGVSDVIEIQTGAWWRPPGLLILKGGCLIGLAWCFLLLGRAR
jgi:hypothetical protein